MDAKQALRASMRSLLRGTPSGAFSDAGAAAAGLLCAQTCWTGASSVVGFLPMRDEVAVEPVLALALSLGKRLALPCVRGDDLLFREVFRADGPWDCGAYGIREPGPSSPAVLPEDLPGPVLVLASGLAFDRSGHRLGRGKGFYDRFLRGFRSARSDVTVIGLGLPAQLVDAVPVDEYDERLDGLCLAGDFLAC